MMDYDPALVQDQEVPDSITQNNVDTFRSKHETKIQWIFRKKFLLHYGSQNQYTPDQLECWSKILSNVKFYGCSYDPIVLNHVNGLLQDMGEDPVMPHPVSNQLPQV
ncbi:uncharacterized protein LOC129592751 [Paramacrobiotus metropolitanus]|uniref:uncharacterized protein LOC129592751 n=1 Tax=Paramacrobiotus metropolitanus TaxID=2943436 RepID=UPI0024459F89|nr:uncharacterized protein LOC129592751 [Paramacrobiotus metropolitanus]